MPPFVHHPAYDASTVPGDHRFPMRKYGHVARLLMEEGYVAPGGFYEPIPAPEAWLEAAHHPDYVRDILSCSVDRNAAKLIGFEITPAISMRSRTSCSGTLLAGRLALEYGAAANTAGGSHHASYQAGGGYCVFNDVAVAARMLLAERAVSQILVVDLDVHQGDGTARIFADEPRVFTLSVHCEENWPRRKPPSDLDVGLPKGAGDTAYLDAVSSALDEAFASVQPDLVFYNAGVDPHLEDRLGLLNLSDEGLKARDACVVDRCKSERVPIAGVLGGGYGKDAEAVARRHLFLFDAMAQAFG
ncbi:MAG: histone deacetylase [Pseudomonadota bacterium]